MLCVSFLPKQTLYFNGGVSIKMLLPEIMRDRLKMRLKLTTFYKEGQYISWVKKRTVKTETFSITTTTE